MKHLVPTLLICCLPVTAAYAQPPICSPLQQNLAVRTVMEDLYLWSSRVSAPDPGAFQTPEAYLEAYRYRPLDQTFSYITSKAANDALYQDSSYIGLGVSSVWRGGRLVLSEVFPSSPAGDAGLSRGDEIVAIGGRSVVDLQNNNELLAAFGRNETGAVTDVEFARGGQRFSRQLAKRPIVIPTVSGVRTFDADGLQVGYLVSRNFVEPTSDALDAAFAELRRQRVTELILDLRYNGGGLVTAAQHLGGLVGGTLTNGQVFVSFEHNDRNHYQDKSLRFRATDRSLTLRRLVVITTRATASAAELVVNALQPFMPVVVIGDRTYGKPVGQYPITFCDKVLAPVSFSSVNASGAGSYFAGLPATCSAEDDIDHGLGDPAESSLKEALWFISHGRCSPAARGEPAAQRTQEIWRRTAGGGWAELLGAN